MQKESSKDLQRVPSSLQLSTDLLMDFRELPKAEERIIKKMLME